MAKVIKLHPNSLFAKMLKETKAKRDELSKRIDERQPSKELLQWMNKRADEVVEMNGGRVNREDFMLGMLSMYYKLKI